MERSERGCISPIIFGEKNPLESLHALAACLQYDHRETDGIGGLTRLSQEQVADLLTQITRIKNVLDEAEHLAVLVARDHGASWAEIGKPLQMSRQAAQQRFGHR